MVVVVVVGVIRSDRYTPTISVIMVVVTITVTIAIACTTIPARLTTTDGVTVLWCRILVVSMMMKEFVQLSGWIYTASIAVRRTVHIVHADAVVVVVVVTIVVVISMRLIIVVVVVIF